MTPRTQPHERRPAWESDEPDRALEEKNTDLPTMHSTSPRSRDDGRGAWSPHDAGRRGLKQARALV